MKSKPTTTAPGYFHRVEDLGVRVLYFFNTIDTYCPLVGLAIFFFLLRGRPPGTVLWAVPAALASYAAFRIGDFHPWLALFLPLPVVYWGVTGSLTFGAVALALLLGLVLFTIIQLLFMGIPDGLVARDATVPFRVLWNSARTLAPTAVSLPITLVYSVFLPLAMQAGTGGHLSAAPPFALLLIWALVVRQMLPKNSASFAPSSSSATRTVRRVVMLNIDGVRVDVFDAVARPEIRHFAREGVELSPGLYTVYRALTNPAFASILTGAPPVVHGVTSNNLGQSIRVEALPDLVPTILYGSMHVQHFSKPDWEVKVTSIVRHSCWKIDDLALEQLMRDLEKREEVRLFIMDLSEADFVGHAYGSESGYYRRSLEKTDERVGRFLRWLDRSGQGKETAVIICSDHGIAVIDHSYLLARSERLVPFIARGPGIKRDRRIPAAGNVMDIGITVAALLGVRPPARARGRVLGEIFEATEKQE